MDPYAAGWLSIIPPVVAIVLALITKRSFFFPNDRYSFPELIFIPSEAELPIQWSKAWKLPLN